MLNLLARTPRMWRHIAPIVVVALSGCSSPKAGMYSPTIWRDSEMLAPARYGADLRQGTRAAVVAFNTEVVADSKTPPVEERKTAQRLTADELREFTDMMFHTFLSALSNVEGLELFPVKHVQENEFYTLMNHPRGALARGFTIVRGNGQRIGPRGLKVIRVPQSEMERSHGLQSIRDTFANLRKDFQGDISHLAKALEVDVVFLVNHKIQITPTANGEFGAELVLMEVIVGGFDAPRQFVFAKHVRGRFSESVASEPSEWAPDTTALMQPKTPIDFSAANANNRYWVTLSKPYHGLCDALRRRLTAIRSR